MNEMDWGIVNGDISGGHCYMNSCTLSEAKNHNYIYSSKKGGENAPNVNEI